MTVQKLDTTMISTSSLPTQKNVFLTTRDLQGLDVQKDETPLKICLCSHVNKPLKLPVETYHQNHQPNKMV